MPTTIFLFILTTCFAWQISSEEVFTQVVLHTSESIGLDGGRLSVNLEEVISDSRCPRGYKCITAGEAKIRISAFEIGRPRQSLVLTGPSQVTYRLSDRYSVQMTALTPYPEAGGRKDQSATATLMLRWPKP
jgi:hypothetical protein